MIQPKTLKPVIIRETLSYKLDRTRARTEARHQPFIEKTPHPVGSVKVLFFSFLFFYVCARRTRFARGGPASHQLFFSTVGDGLARARAPGPQAAQLSLCTPETLVSPDILAIPSRYRTDFPAVPSWYCTDLISTRNYGLVTQVNS